jgi:Ca2+-binding EF-hand superfamily protein
VAELKKLPEEERAAMDQMDAYGRPAEMLANPAQAAELFKRLDANDDKMVSASEAPPALAGRFAQMLQHGDRDGDQRLSQKEFLDLSRQIAEFEGAKADPTAVRRAMRQLLNRFDRDGDARLSLKEAPPRIADNFDKADANADGTLDKVELTRVTKTMVRAQKFSGKRAQPGRPVPARKANAAKKPRGKSGN